MTREKIYFLCNTYRDRCSSVFAVHSYNNEYILMTDSYLGHQGFLSLAALKFIIFTPKIMNPGFPLVFYIVSLYMKYIIFHEESISSF